MSPYFHRCMTKLIHALIKTNNTHNSSIRSDEGLTLDTSAFQIFRGGSSTFINSFDETQCLLNSTLCADWEELGNVFTVSYVLICFFGKISTYRNTKDIWSPLGRGVIHWLICHMARFPLFSQDYIAYSPPIINCLKSWWRLLIGTGKCGAESLIPLQLFPSKHQINYNYTAPNNTSILLNHLITFEFI